MEVQFDKTGTTWNNEITPKQIFEREFKPAHFLLNHSHEIISKILPELFCRYKVVMKFTDNGYNNGNIYVTKCLAFRKKKFGKVEFTKGVKLLEGTPTESGGSNAYPCVAFKEGYCILEFETDGLPCTNWLSGWKTELISLEKI